MSDERRLIPIYDASAPIACTLTAGGVQERSELLEWLRTNLTRIDRTEHGMFLHFRAAAEVDDQLRHFASVEKQCCRFWGFDIERSASTTTLRWDAPPAANHLVEQLLAWFAGDDSIDLARLL